MCGGSKFPDKDQNLFGIPPLEPPPLFNPHFGPKAQGQSNKVNLGERLQVLDQNRDDRFKIADGDRVKLDGRFVDPKSPEVQAELKRLGITESLSEIQNLRNVLNVDAIKLSDELTVKDQNGDGVLKEADGDSVEVSGKAVSSASPTAKEALRKLHLKRQKDQERFGGSNPLPPWPTDPQDDTEAVSSLSQIKNLAALKRYLDYMKKAEEMAHFGMKAGSVHKILSYAREAAAKAGVVLDAEWGRNITAIAEKPQGFDSAVGIFREWPSELKHSEKESTAGGSVGFMGGIGIFKPEHILMIPHPMECIGGASEVGRGTCDDPGPRRVNTGY